MAVPTFAGPYATQNEIVDTTVNFDASAGWTDAVSFEVAVKPPGFLFDEATGVFSGDNNALMDYTIFVRGIGLLDEKPAGVNGGFEPLQWITTGGPVTLRKLWGLSLEYQEVNAQGIAATLFGKRMPSGAGTMFINDIGDSIIRDGTADQYDAGLLIKQILLSGGADTLIRATVPGWEIIIDTSS